MAAAKAYTTMVLARTDEQLADVAGLSRADVRFYVGLRDGGELFRVSRSAARQWDKLFVEVDASGELHCDCGKSRCCHRGAVRLWLAQRARQATGRAA